MKTTRKTKNISVLIPKGDISLSNVEGIHHIFSEANKMLERIGKEPLFKFQLIGERKNNLLKENFFSIHPKFLLDEDLETDLLIIPALHGDMLSSLELNKELIPWIVEQHKKGTEIMSLCTGAFLLASTGLLSGKSCTTHWIHANDFKEMFPDINLLDDRIMTDENGIYTSGAAYSYLNLILHVLEKYTNRSVVTFIAKVFAIDIGRESQSQFIIFQGYKHHSDECILKAQEFIEDNFQDKLSIDELADMFSLGRRSLERRFKKATNNTVVEYIQRVKVEAAKKSFETSSKNINEVMYDVGYNDTKAFRSTFKKISGLSPLDYKKKYNKDLVA